MENWVDGFIGDNKGYATTGYTTTGEIVNMQYDDNSNGMGAGRTYFPKGFLLSKDDPDAPAIFFPSNRSNATCYYTSNQSTMYGSRPMIVNISMFYQSYGLRRDPNSKIIVPMYTPGVVRCVREDY